MHLCTCWIVRIRHGRNIIDAVLSGNILWCRPVIVHPRSGRIVRGKLRCSERNPLRERLLPAVDGTDVMHCSRGRLICSRTRSDLVVALRFRII